MGGGVADIERILNWTPRRLFVVFEELMLQTYQDDAARHGVSRYKARAALHKTEPRAMTQHQRNIVERDLLN